MDQECITYKQGQETNKNYFSNRKNGKKIAVAQEKRCAQRLTSKRAHNNTKDETGSSSFANCIEY
jgi:hypothetical protein